MSEATPFPKSTPTSLMKRLCKQKEIVRLEAKDREKINRILRTIMEKGGSITPTNLHRQICGPIKLGRVPKPKSDRKGISPRFYYGYLIWLKQNAYVTQEKRQPIILSPKGRDYWRSRDMVEAIRDLESPEKILAKIMEIGVFIRDKYARRAEKTVLSVSRQLDEKTARMVKEAMTRMLKTERMRTTLILEKVVRYVPEDKKKACLHEVMTALEGSKIS